MYTFAGRLWNNGQKMSVRRDEEVSATYAWSDWPSLGRKLPTGLLMAWLSTVRVCSDDHFPIQLVIWHNLMIKIVSPGAFIRYG